MESPLFLGTLHCRRSGQLSKVVEAGMVAWQNKSMIRRVIWASVLTVALWFWLQQLFPSHPPGAAATTLAFAIMFGLVYAVEYLSPGVRRVASAAKRRRMRRRASDSIKGEK